MTIITFKLPGRGKWKVEQDEKILPGQVIGEVKVGGGEKSLPLAKILGVNPQKISKYLVKKVGDKLASGELLAQKKTLFKKIAIFAPLTGEIKKIDEQGNLVIGEEEKSQELKSDVDGVVKKVSQNELEIEFAGQVFRGIKGTGEKVVGEIRYFGKEEIGLSDFKKDLEGKTVCLGRLGRAGLEKLFSLEAGGVVLTTISEENFARISQGKIWEIGEARQFLRLSLLVINEPDLEVLRNYQGKKAILDPEEKRLIVCP